jgi:hypothetical protein
MLTDAAGLVIEDERFLAQGDSNASCQRYSKAFRLWVVLKDRDGSIAQLNTPRANTESPAVAPAKMEMLAGVQIGCISVSDLTPTLTLYVPNRSLHNIQS